MNTSLKSMLVFDTIFQKKRKITLNYIYINFTKYIPAKTAKKPTTKLAMV